MFAERERKGTEHMGTDIHMAVEVRNDEGEWEFVPGPIIDCILCDGTGMKTAWEMGVKVHSATEKCMWCCTTPDDEQDLFDREYTLRRYVAPGKRRDTWYSDRNYVVFAILGNVRNGHGFAGVYTHDPIPYISSDRGIPDDATTQALAELSGDHSATWCTLAEIMDYPWRAPMHRGGVVTLEEYQRCRIAGERPSSWSAGITGHGIVTVSPRDADAILAGDLRAIAEKVHVQYEWDDTLGDTTRYFLDRMKMLAMEVGEHDCRLIMDFDS
jgi:hypothetical protein